MYICVYVHIIKYVYDSMHTCVIHIYIYTCTESCWSKKSHPSKDWKWSTPGEKKAAGPDAQSDFGLGYNAYQDRTGPRFSIQMCFGI